MSSWWEVYQAWLPDDADLVASRDTPGRLRGFFRREGGIEGHAELSKIDLRGPAAVVTAIALAAGVLGTVVVIRQAPRVRRWWDDQAIPTIRKMRKKITRQRTAAAQETPTEMAILSKAALDAFSTEIDVALEDIRSSMSSAEAQRHLLEILMAASIIADRMRTLSNARIEDNADLPELKTVLEKLTTRQVTDAINRMLATNTSTLDDETSDIFARIFGGGHVVGGEYVPLRNDRIKEALSLDPRITEPLAAP